jgi:hypothetical protein
LRDIAFNTAQRAGVPTKELSSKLADFAESDAEASGTFAKD